MRRIPFLLSPIGKDYLWGGRRLKDDFNLDLSCEPLAEAWVCSTHPDGSTRLYSGESLREVLLTHPDWIGSHPLAITGGKAELPILIKLIDAKEDLSVQVHPDDEFALKEEKSLGKSEMWYVLDAKPGARLAFGFNQNMKQDWIKEALVEGTIDRYINYLPVYKDNLFFIEAGTVHAIGKGCLVAEIQESSNITYRLYDYGRIDKNGKQRELHIDKAIKVINLSNSVAPRQPMRVLKYRNGTASELLCRCKYFQVERMLLNTEIQRQLATFRTGSNSFHVLLVTNGCGSLSGEDVFINFFKGDCIFIPADSIPLKLHGRAQILNVSC